MARQIGSTFRGTTPDGLTFYYHRRYGHLVRRTGGITSKQYHKDKRFAAARDASSEFCTISSSGKLIREALVDFVLPVKDGTMVNRLNRELVALKQLDTIHNRGERRPDTMMADTTANSWFRIFQFNEKVKLYDLTEQFPQVSLHKSVETGCIMSNLTVNNIQLKASEFPEGATHAGLTLVRTVIDFNNNRFETHSSRMALVSGDKTMNLSLELPNVPSCTGIELVCIQSLFFREQNGDLLQLKDKVHAMGIISIKSVQTECLLSPYDTNILTQSKPVETGCFLSHLPVRRSIIRRGRACPINSPPVCR